MHACAADILKGLAHEGLRPVTLLGRSRRGDVWLLAEAQGRRLVLKRYAPGFDGFERERDFLLCSRRDLLRTLYLPEVIEAGEDFLLLEFVPREHLARETVTTRAWADDDVDLWVKGLLEFQQLKPSRRAFSITQRLAGLAYPVVRTVEQLRRYGKHLTLRQQLLIAQMALVYLVQRPFFRNVCTHYDLQTTNYTFMTSQRRMSMLDCEFSYYLGDPYFDVLYYITIPPVHWSDWTFQRRLLTAFLSSMQGRRRMNAGRNNRIRLILLSCNIARYLHFDDDPDKQRIYAANISDALGGKTFAALLKQVRSD